MPPQVHFLLAVLLFPVHVTAFIFLLNVSYFVVVVVVVGNWTFHVIYYSSPGRWLSSTAPFQALLYYLLVYFFIN